MICRLWESCPRGKPEAARPGVTGDGVKTMGVTAVRIQTLN